jgi:hypothetical protein
MTRSAYREPFNAQLAVFEERRQLFIRTHNETLSVVAMCVNNPDRSPVAIHG